MCCILHNYLLEDVGEFGNSGDMLGTLELPEDLDEPYSGNEGDISLRRELFAQFVRSQG